MDLWGYKKQAIHEAVRKLGYKWDGVLTTGLWLHAKNKHGEMCLISRQRLDLSPGYREV